MSYVAAITHQKIKVRNSVSGSITCTLRKLELHGQREILLKLHPVQKVWVHLPSLQGSVADRGFRRTLLGDPRENVVKKDKNFEIP